MAGRLLPPRLVCCALRVPHTASLSPAWCNADFRLRCAEEGRGLYSVRANARTATPAGAWGNGAATATVRPRRSACHIALVMQPQDVMRLRATLPTRRACALLGPGQRVRARAVSEALLRRAETCPPWRLGERGACDCRRMSARVRAGPITGRRSVLLTCSADRCRTIGTFGTYSAPLPLAVTA